MNEPIKYTSPRELINDLAEQLLQQAVGDEAKEAITEYRRALLEFF